MGRGETFTMPQIDEHDASSLSSMIDRGFDAVDAVLGMDSRKGPQGKGRRASFESAPASAQVADTNPARALTGEIAPYQIKAFSASGVRMFMVTDGTEDGSVMCRRLFVGWVPHAGTSQVDIRFPNPHLANS